VKQVIHYFIGPRWVAFSILERIDVGETLGITLDMTQVKTFSILERIDVGETRARRRRVAGNPPRFQYPRTDRRG